MLPLVAREYGQVWCAASANSRTFSRSIPGTWMTSVTTKPKESPSGPMPTCAVTVESPSAACSRPATRRSALWKQAA